MDLSEDEALVQRAAGGDRAAWRLLVRRHAGSVHAAAWYLLGDRSEAEDVTQETFLRFLGKARTWRAGEATIKTWLHRVATNLCVDRWRSGRKTELNAHLMEEGVDLEPGMRAALDRRLRIESALAALPVRQRTAIVLVYYQGFSGLEAAQILAVSEDALESLLRRARRTLKQQLEPVASDLLCEV
ncbi:MAG TPA: sigma-70 family RNA polymerase sigma factor [Alphaproteobacteria bacterium]|nr:sigma-70 family RNA polymerase sigma factor [Alphaproteobacteria bacterium]